MLTSPSRLTGGPTISTRYSTLAREPRSSAREPRSSARSPTLAKDAPDQLIMSSEESRAVPAPRGAARVRRASYSRPVSADGRIVISMRQGVICGAMLLLMAAALPARADVKIAYVDIQRALNECN